MITQIHISSLKLSDEEINTHDFAQSIYENGISCTERIISDANPHHFVSYGANKNCWYTFDGTFGIYGDCDRIGGIYGI